MFLFADTLPGLCAYLNSLCSSSCTPAELAMAGNLLAEHRVSAERSADFASYLPSVPVTASEIEEALRTYQKVKVRVLKDAGIDPCYELPPNSDNWFHPVPGTELCSVIDLTRLGYIYSEAQVRGMAGFRHFSTAAPTYDDVNSFLDEPLSDDTRRGNFMKNLFAALAMYRSEVATQIHPVWAAEWKSISPYLVPGNPSRWLEAVGVPKATSLWVAIVRYPAPERVYRPTQLDAGWFAHHFPSTPAAALANGGFTMDLGSPESEEQGLVSEFIHRQIDFTREHWESAGSLVGFFASPTECSNNLGHLRNRHIEVLKRRYPETDVLWAARMSEKYNPKGIKS